MGAIGLRLDPRTRPVTRVASLDDGERPADEAGRADHHHTGLDPPLAPKRAPARVVGTAPDGNEIGGVALEYVAKLLFEFHCHDLMCPSERSRDASAR